MAAIQDVSGTFTGTTLQMFDAMQAAIVRDGDVAFAQAEMQAAMRKVLTTTGPNTSGSGQTGELQTFGARRERRGGPSKVLAVLLPIAIGSLHKIPKVGVGGQK